MCLVDIEIGTWRRHFNQLLKCSQDLEVSPDSNNGMDMVDVIATLDDADESDYENDLEFQEAVEELQELQGSPALNQELDSNSDAGEQEPPVEQAAVQETSTVRRSERGNKGVKPTRHGEE